MLIIGERYGFLKVCSAGIGGGKCFLCVDQCIISGVCGVAVKMITSSRYVSFGCMAVMRTLSFSAVQPPPCVYCEASLNKEK